MIYVANGGDLVDNAFIKTDLNPVIFNYPHLGYAELNASPIPWTWWEDGNTYDYANGFKNPDDGKFY
jgi:hypothetical protein